MEASLAQGAGAMWENIRVVSHIEPGGERESPGLCLLMGNALFSLPNEEEEAQEGGDVEEDPWSSSGHWWSATPVW